MRLSSRPVSLGAVVLAGTCLVGCSALQIDVDVYKGPLASQRDVQLRQFANLAIAAKPLLAELRNDTEDLRFTDYRSLVSGKDLEQYTGTYPYREPLARFVNGVLFFYEDRDAFGQIPEANHALAQQARFQSHLARFNVVQSDCELAEALSKKTPSATSTTARAPDASLEKLRETYKNFLLAGSPLEQASCSARLRLKDAYSASAADGKRRVEDVRTVWNGREHGRKMAVSVSEAYLQLAQGGLAEDQARVLFQDDADAANRFAQRLQEIGRSFVEARQTLQELLWTGLQLQKIIHERGGFRQRDPVHQLISVTVEPRVLGCYVGVFGAQHEKEADIVAFLTDATGGIPAKWTWQQSRSNYVRGNAAVERAARQFGGRFALFLAKVDANLRDMELDRTRLQGCSQYVDAGSGAKEELSYTSKAYGLARGTAADNELDAVVARLEPQLAEISISGGFGFDVARPPEGIHRLTQNYLDAIDGRGIYRGNPDAQGEAQRRLEEILLLFAERMLYVVNNYHLIRNESRSNSYQGFEPERGATRSDVANLLDKETFARKAAVLEAMGNTIVVLADDIRRQRGHDTSLAARSQSEALAINRAFALNASSTFDALVHEVRQGAVRDQAEADRAAAQSKRIQDAADPLSKPIFEARARLATDKQKATKLEGEAAAALDQAVALRNTALTVATAGTARSITQLSDDVDARRDRSEVDLFVRGLPAKVTGEQIRQRVQAWLGEQIPAERLSGSTKRLGRLEASSAFLAANQAAFAGIAEQDQRAAWSKFKSFVSSSSSKRETSAQTAASLREAAKQEVSDGEQRIAVLSRELENQTRGKADLEARSRGLATSADEMVQSLSAISEVKAEVVAKAGDVPGIEPRTVLRYMTEELEKKVQAAKSADSSAGGTSARKYELALAYVKRANPVGALAVRASGPASDPQRGRTQKDVLDELIAQLRQQHLQAVASGDTARASNLEKALGVAFEQRSGMAYLRPASAFLRNVYGATSVRPDPDVGWTNLLARAAGRPLGQPSPLQSAQVAVEKQFWERVNTIELSGAGASNYVVAKDDVGNWYVKAYGSDTESIVQSAQSLALFNMGKRFDVNLLRQANIQSRLNRGDLTSEQRETLLREQDAEHLRGGATSGASTAGLASVQAKYAAEHARQTAGDADALDDALANLNADIGAGWVRDLSGDGKSALIEKIKPLIADTSDEMKAAQSRIATARGAAEAERTTALSDAIVDALRAANRLRARLVNAIRRNAALTSAEQVDLATTTQKQAMAQSDLATQTQKRDQLAIKVRTIQEIVGAGSPATPELQDAQRALTLAEVAVTDAKTRADAATAAAATAADALKAAEANQAQAATTVNSVISNLILDVTDRRIDAVKRVETAFGFIGEAAGAR